MKRYLITGALAFVLCSWLVSCHEKSEFSGGEMVQAKIDAFDKMFVEAYGEIAPDHDWGFGSISAARTRGSNPNGNQWGDKYNIPDPITRDEREAVLAVFNQRGEASYTSLVDWSTFFVQQVYKGIATYTDSAGNEGIVGSDKMNWLYAVANGKGDHIFNFNAGDSKDWGGMMLMENSSTQAFGFSNSNGQGRLFLNFRMEHIEGYGYYVGFDFESWRASEANGNEGVARDYIYNDWIVKIVPGVKKNGDTPEVPKVVTVSSAVSPTYKVYKRSEVTEVGRVLAEDLGSSNRNDMDFNDVVFDARIIKDIIKVEETTNGVTETKTSGSYTVKGISYTAGYGNPRANIKLLAAGGTIPITVEGVDVHNAFGKVAKTTMINTYNPEMNNGMYITKDPVDLINPNKSEDAKYDFDGIETIYNIEVAAELNGSVVPINNVGGVPHKILVPVSTPWPIERVEMNTAYSNKFGATKGNVITSGGYVQDKTIHFWEYPVDTKVKFLEGIKSQVGDIIGNNWTLIAKSDAGETTYGIAYEDADNSAIGSLGFGWATVWSRSDSYPGYLYNDGTNHTVTIPGYLFANVNGGTKLRIYGVSRNGWSITSALGTASGYSNTSEGYIEYTLENETIKTSGLEISGNLFTVVRVDILPAEVQPQQPEEPEHVEATPGNTETDVLTSAIEFTQYSTQTLSNSLFASVEEGTKLRVYGWATTSSSSFAIRSGNNDSDMTSATLSTVNSEKTMSADGYVELTLTRAGAKKLKDVGLMLAGQNFKFSHVTLDNSSVPEKETYPSGTVVNLSSESKSKHYNWGDETIIISTSKFTKAKAGDQIRITCSTYCEPGQPATGEWRLYPGVSINGQWTKLEPSPWYGDNDGYIRNGQNPNHYDGTYITFKLSEKSLDLLGDYDMMIAFSGLQVTQVDLIAE